MFENPMDLTLGNQLIYVSQWIVIVCSLLFAFIVTFGVIPSIIGVANAKGLFDDPNERTSHTRRIPTLGGAAVFLGMILPTAIFGHQSFDHELKFIMAGLLILFFIGIKDDILVISVRKKLISEIFAIAIIILFGGIKISSFHGLLGVFELPNIISIIFTLFVFIVIINGFNLIDGIDGLASGIGILTASLFGVWFFLIEDFSYSVFCFATVGALIAFFYYNVFGRRNKIFLGDTGSLIIGLTISIFTIKFLESNLDHQLLTINESAPAIAFGVLIVPMIDTLRIFSIRIFAGKSPFKPDCHHIHHKLLNLGLSHIKATLFIVGFNLLIFVLSLSLSHLGNLRLLAITIPISIFLTAIPSTILRYRNRRYFARIGLFGNKSWIIPQSVSKLSGFSVRKKAGLDSEQMAEVNQRQIDLEPINT